MSSAASQPDLIIALSRDKVSLNLSANAKGRNNLNKSFEVDGMFMEEQISQSLDQILTENPVLIDQFPCVEIILIDRPNITMPGQYAANEKLAEIASRHLRLRAGDTLTTDSTGDKFILCYTMPTDTLQMLREYYANVGVTHLSSVLWQYISNQLFVRDKTITCFTIIYNTLIVLTSEQGKLIFSKNFNIRDKADLFYYAMACSRMMKSTEQWLITIENEENAFEMPGDSILKMDQHLSIPSLHVLMSQYKPCGS